MAGNLIPSPELAPPSVHHLPVAKRVELWYQLLDESEALLLAGLRAKIGSEGDLHEAYRQWYDRKMSERDRARRRFLINLSRCEAMYYGE